MTTTAADRATQGYALARDEGEAFWLLGMLQTVKIGKADARGAFGLLEIVVPPGLGSPWHVHPEGHELVYVVEGEQTFEIDGVGTKVVKAGEVIHTPPNVAHYGRNATEKLSKTVVIRIKDKSQPIMVETKQ